MLRNSSTGDWDLAAGLVFADGLDAVIQGAESALQLATNEWFLNLDAGTPWDEILGKKPTLERLREIFRDRLLGRPDIIALHSLSVTQSNRSLTVTWTALTTEGLAQSITEVLA